MTDSHRSHVVVVAAENGALAGAKVGGVADVIHEVPLALAKKAIDVTVLTPSHGFLHELPGAKRLDDTEFHFAGGAQSASLFEIPQPRPCAPSQRNTAPVTQGYVRQLVIDHPALATGHKGQLYLSDASDRPFARDSTRFACFSAACAAIIDHDLGRPVDVLHLHDWHVGYLSILRHTGKYPSLTNTRTVFTIHNLAFQGVRPIRDDNSSFLAWFPDIEPDSEIIGDPRWPWCVNPLAAAVRLSDAIHVVSPSYAKEIQLPDKAEAGAGTGGCGLEQLLVDANSEQRLFGILNGCHYGDSDGDSCSESISRLSWRKLQSAIHDAIDKQQVTDADSSSKRITEVLSQLARTGPAPLITSVGRIADQKTGLLLHSVDHDKLAIDALLNDLGDQGLLIMLGSGDGDMELALGQAATRHENFLLLRGFSEALADALYRSGDLFLMPSTFEPCGISQMLAMRAGQPCLVHSVGGLKDTIDSQVNGFAFSADSRENQAKALVDAASACFARYRNQPYRDWQHICEAARQARFEWSTTVDQYISKLYAPAISPKQPKS